MVQCLLWVLVFLTGCSGVEEAQKKQMKERNERKDLIHRLSNEQNYSIKKLALQPKSPYPWESGFTGVHPLITKEAFRCKAVKNSTGSGREHKHSLPLRGGQEFIYPVLLDILNYIQIKTGLAVVITSGHRCPEHHNQMDPSSYNKNSKHMIGAEVDFYVEGMESKPLDVIQHVMSYYKDTDLYKKEKEYVIFNRLDHVKVDVVTVPWFNKEILIKLYQKNEGRDGENQHPYPYISLQVRFDRETKEKVIFSSDKASNGFKRY